MPWRKCTIPARRPYDSLIGQVFHEANINHDAALFYRVTEDGQYLVLLLSPPVAHLQNNFQAEWQASEDHHRRQWQLVAGFANAYERLGIEPPGGFMNGRDISQDHEHHHHDHGDEHDHHH